VTNTFVGFVSKNVSNLSDVPDVQEVSNASNVLEITNVQEVTIVSKESESDQKIDSTIFFETLVQNLELEKEREENKSFRDIFEDVRQQLSDKLKIDRKDGLSGEDIFIFPKKKKQGCILLFIAETYLKIFFIEINFRIRFPSS
jgi:hypothetical protein